LVLASPRGYATLGKIGFEGRFDYAAIGTVANLSARLSAEAKAERPERDRGSR
jgi:class 3 adenylate cyclase